MSDEEKNALIMKLFDLLESLEKRLGELEKRVEKTSRNSSKPPSSDGLKRQAADACGREHRGVFHTVMPHVSYGPNLKAYAVSLVDRHFVSLARTAEIIADQYGIKPSDGSIQKWIGQIAERMGDCYAAIGQRISAAQVAHFDESGGPNPMAACGGDERASFLYDTHQARPRGDDGGGDTARVHRLCGTRSLDTLFRLRRSDPQLVQRPYSA